MDSISASGLETEIPEDRALIEKMLVDLGLQGQPVIEMSRSILGVRRDYNRELRRIAEGRAEWDGWMKLFLDCIDRSCDDVLSVIEGDW